MSTVRVLYRKPCGGWANRYFLKMREASSWAKRNSGQIAEPAVPANHEGTAVPVRRPAKVFKAESKKQPRR